MKILTAAIGLIALAIQPTWCFGASFDCRKAATAVEKLVCSSNEIRALDVRLYEEYQRAQRLSADANAIRDQQRRWLKKSRNPCKTVECLSKVYEVRISELETGIRYDECKDESGSSLSIGYCAARIKNETEKTISDLITLLSVRNDSQQMERFNQKQDEWKKNVECSCFEQVGQGSGSGHSLMIVGCEQNEVGQRLWEIRMIVAGAEDLDYGGNNPKSCVDVREDEEADRMFAAIRNNDVETVKRLQIQGVSIPTLRDGQTPLEAAVENDATEVVKYLLATGFRPDQVLISWHCNNRITILQIEHGASVKKSDISIIDPLSRAAYFGCTDIVKYLVVKGAGLKSAKTIDDGSKRLPFRDGALPNN